jgi:hypothetical protein
MNDTAPGRHPLDVARADDAAVPHAGAVLDRALEDVGDSLDPAMGMPWEACEVVVGII